MIYKILKAIHDDPVKNDFVMTYKKYLEVLKMKITLEDIEKVTKYQLKRMLVEKIKIEAFVFLKNQQLKQEKIKNIVYKELKMQDYLADGDRDINVSRIIYKARGQNLDIKTHKRWKYNDIICEGCNENIESGEEVMKCDRLGENKEEIRYDWFYSEMVCKQISAGKILIKKLKKRKQIREEIT